MSERGARIRRCEWAKLGKTEIETVLLCLATTGQLHFANCLLYCLLHCLSQIADCGLQIADCELRIANCELRIANCPLSIAYLMQIACASPMGRQQTHHLCSDAVKRAECLEVM